jgi:protein SCO1/2
MRASGAVRRAATTAALLLLALLAPGLPGGPARAAPEAPRWGRDYFPNVPLVTQDGKVVHFYDDLIQGKVVAINFIFTSCSETCPAETARLRQVYKLLGDRVGRDVFLYSISIDPEHDTPEVLKAYREKFRIGPGWTFLTGKQEDVTLLRRKLGLRTDDVTDGNRDHATSFVVGNEATGQWIKRSPFDNPRILAGLLGERLHNWKTGPGGAAQASYAEATLIEKFSRGEYLFRTRCSSCHTLGASAAADPVGPDLLGVVDKRSPEWLARWLKAPDAMIAERDPVALELLAQYRDLRMPNLSLNDVDVASLIEFMESESLRAVEAREREAAAGAATADPHAHHHHR